MLRGAPRALQSLLGTPPERSKSAPRASKERSERPQERSKSPQQRSDSSNGALRALQSSGYARKRVAAKILRFVSGERAIEARRKHAADRSQRERESDRVRERESWRARERESERARERESKSARERESERARERVSEAAQSPLNGSLSKREQSELRSYREPSPHSNVNKTLCIKCKGQL